MSPAPQGKYTAADVVQLSPAAQTGKYSVSDLAPAASDSTADAGPSPFHQFLSEYGAKINPIANAQGVVSAATHPVDAAKGYAQQNSGLLQRAEDSFKSGDYVGAAVHGLYYLMNGVPGVGAALDEAGNKFRSGDSAGGLADTAGLATNLYAGAKLPAMAGEVADVAGKIPGAVKGAIAADPAVALARAGILPKESEFLDKLPEAMADIKASGVIGGNNSLRAASAAALNKNSAAFETNYLGPARAAGAKASGAPIVQATTDAIPEMLKRENPAQAKGLVDTATKAYGGDLTTDQLHQLLIEKNALLKSFYDQSPAAQQAAATSGMPEAVVKAQRDAIANTLYQTLDPQNAGAGPREIQARRGAVQDIANEAEKRNLKILAEKPVSTAGALGKTAGGVLTAIPKTFLKGDPEGAASGITTPFRGSSDPLIRRAFSNVPQAKPFPTPAAPPAANLPATPAAPAGGAAPPTATPPAPTPPAAAPAAASPNSSAIATGPHGPIFTQFLGKPAAAIDALRASQSGEAMGALHHPELGDIDLVWGKPGDPANDYEGGYGLAHIEAKHPEIGAKLPEIVSKANVISQSGNRAVLESADHRAIVRMAWNDTAKQWLLTAYEKETPPTSGRTTGVPGTPASKGPGSGETPSPSGSATSNIAPSTPPVKPGKQP